MIQTYIINSYSELLRKLSWDELISRIFPPVSSNSQQQQSLSQTQKFSPEVNYLHTAESLFRNESFMLDEMFQQKFQKPIMYSYFHATFLKFSSDKIP